MVDRFHGDAVRLAAGSLIAEHIREPGDKDIHDSEPMYPALMRHLAREALEPG